MTTRQLTAHYHRSQQQELAPALLLVGVDGQDARAIHGSSRSATVHPSAFVPMVQGSSSWPLWVDATDLCCLRDLMMMMMMMIRLGDTNIAGYPSHLTVCFIRQLFVNNKNFAGSAAFADVCAHLSSYNLSFAYHTEPANIAKHTKVQ